MRIEWLPAAIDSLQNQLAYIERRNPEAAVGRLVVHPSIGRSGRRPGTRELVVARTPFLVVYRVEVDVIAILRLFHGAEASPNMP